MKRPEILAYALAALAVVAVVVCKLAGVDTPELLTYVATTALGAGAGVQVAGGPATANLPAGAPRAQLSDGKFYGPAPTPLTSEPPTGVFRAVTHAP